MVDKYLTDSGFTATTGAAATGGEIFTLSNAVGSTITMLLSEVGNYIAKLFAPTAWVAPTFTNGWANFVTTEGSNGTVAGYCKVPLSQEVRLKGLIKSGASGVAAFTLPTGFRPSKAFSLTAHTYNTSTNVIAPIELAVGTDGTVVPFGSISSFVSLDGLVVPLV